MLLGAALAVVVVACRPVVVVACPGFDVVEVDPGSDRLLVVVVEPPRPPPPAAGAVVTPGPVP